MFVQLSAAAALLALTLSTGVQDPAPASMPDTLAAAAPLTDIVSGKLCITDSTIPSLIGSSFEAKWDADCQGECGILILLGDGLLLKGVITGDKITIGTPPEDTVTGTLKPE